MTAPPKGGSRIFRFDSGVFFRDLWNSIGESCAPRAVTRAGSRLRSFYPFLPHPGSLGFLRLPTLLTAASMRTVIRAVLKTDSFTVVILAATNPDGANPPYTE